MYLYNILLPLHEVRNRFLCNNVLQSHDFHLNHIRDAPVAQLDRVLDYESRGRGFESSPVRHINQRLSGNYAGPFVFRGNIWGNKLISFITLAVVSLREV